MNEKDAIIGAEYYTIDEQTRIDLEANLALCLQVLALRYNMLDKRELMLYACDQCMTNTEEETDNPYYLLLRKVKNNEIIMAQHTSRMEMLCSIIEHILIALQDDLLNDD